MCANDIRKRDVQIAKLKTFLSDRQRGATGPAGSTRAVVGPNCTIIGGQAAGTSARRSAQATGRASASALSGRSASPGNAEQPVVPNVQDAGYTLQQETNAFLTQLSQTLSDENDALIALIRNTLTTLKEVQGQGIPLNSNTNTNSSWQPQQSLPYSGPKDSGISIPPADDAQPYAEMLAPPSIDVLASELESTLATLRSLLSNPSFAPVEEVQVREEEIQRLREGWEKMEMRWREAVGMMVGWRRKMVGQEEGGGVSNGNGGDERGREERRWQSEMEELTRGLDEVTMTMEGLTGRKKGRWSLSRPLEEVSMVENVDDSTYESSQLEGEEEEEVAEGESHVEEDSHIEEQGEEESHIEEDGSLAPDETHIDDDNDAEDSDSVDHGDNDSDNDTMTFHRASRPSPSYSQPQAQALSQSNSNNSHHLTIPVLPSRSPLRTSSSTSSNQLQVQPPPWQPPPSAMKFKTSQRNLGDLRHKVSFQHLQSPSIIDAEGYRDGNGRERAGEEDFDDLG